MIRFLSTIATVVLVAVLTIREVRGQSEEVEWKFYGGGSPNEQRKEQSLCFYDASSVARQADGHIRVWTKCLSNPALNNTTRVYYEINCADKLMRGLGTRFQVSGKWFEDTSSDWFYSAPQINGARLFKILCPK